KEPTGFGPEAKQDKEPEASPLAASPQPKRQTAKLQAGKQWAHILAEQGVGMAMSTPALSGKYAYLTVAHGAIARFGALYCIDLETHKTVWTFDAGKTMKQGYSSPV